MAIGTKRIEDYLPVVKYNEGLYTELALTVASGAVVTLPSTTTIGGSAVVALGDITSSATTGNMFTVTNTGVYTGTGVVSIVANSATTGVISLLTANGLTTGVASRITSSGVIATTGRLLSLVASGLTTGTALDFGALQALTTGVGILMAHTTSVIADGGSLVQLSSSSIDTGGATNGTILDLKSTAQLAGTIVRLDNILTTGTAMSIIGTGVMTTTGNLLTLTANSATTAAGLLRINANGLTDGIGLVITSSATAMTSTGRMLLVNHTGTTGTSTIIAEVKSAATDETIVFRSLSSGAITGVVQSANALATVTGIIHESRATAATLTTGRYYSAHDAAGEVFGVGLNGHLISTVSATPPTIAVTTQNGITAAAITSGGSDTCGIITTTGTSTAATVLDVTFGKTYTTAPKAVILTAANASASMPNTAYYVSAISATTFTITVPAGGTYAATPSFRYLVIA